MRKLVLEHKVKTKGDADKGERCPAASKAVLEMKRGLRQQYLGQFADLHLLDLSLHEAESVAWDTTFPHLFFPILAEEKVTNALVWAERQRAVKASTSELSFAA
ncbi:MAG: hypothetical protein H0X66_04620 [Verrucomicrobia bacterium]|nr:hypothetical protein [Verrucomicrobiota bacterium]